MTLADKLEAHFKASMQILIDNWRAAADHVTPFESADDAYVTCADDLEAMLAAIAREAK